MKIYNSILETIGHTPLVKAPYFSKGLNSEIIFKLESFNPMSSVKDRIAMSMIEDALTTKTINSNSVLVEPTSGNTGVGLALVCAAKHLRLIMTMPDTMSIERQKIMKALGAELILTEGSKGMKGAIEKAEEIKNKTKNAVLVGQFSNPANPEIHRKTTAMEIWEDTDGELDVFLAGVGTGGTLTGCGEALKKMNPEIQVIAVEPTDSPVISQCKNGEDLKPGPHKIQGIGAGFIPDILNVQIIDRVVQITNDQAFQAARKLAKEDGLMVGISSGAVAHAAYQLAHEPEMKGKRIVAILASHGERYLSTPLFDD